MRSLKGLTIVMMGATGGMGTATALQLASQGVNIAFSSSNADRVTALQEKLANTGASIYGAVVNVTDCQQVDQFMDSVFHKFGQVDVLINFAGLSITAKLNDFTEEQYNTVMDVNVKGMVFSTKALASRVDPARGALVINIGSMAAKRANPNAPHYSAAKAALIGATKALAQEVASRDVTVNAIAPGFIETDMTKNLPVEELKKLVPMNRFGKPEEVASLVGFLVTPDASYITGEVININGGLYT